MSVFVHPQGICESSNVGAGTRVWAFAHVLPGAQVGQDCNICDGVFVENNVVLGDRVTVKCGVQLWDGLRIEDDVFIGPNVAFSNDKFPRSKVYDKPVAETRVARGASLGANSTILPGLSIGRHAMVGAGSVVTRNVPPYAIVTGNPARITGYVDSKKTAQEPAEDAAPKSIAKTVSNLSVEGVTLHQFPSYEDLRGRLSVGDFPGDIPFEPKRFFLVYEVPSKYVRGEHAHKRCKQFLICASGRVKLMVDDGANREEVLLDRPGLGVYIPPMVWGTQYQYSDDAVLLVFASEHYDAADYIRDYDVFLQLKGA